MSKEFNSPFEALNWCYKNPLREIFVTNSKEQYFSNSCYSKYNLQRYNPENDRIEFKALDFDSNWYISFLSLSSMMDLQVKWKIYEEKRSTKKIKKLKNELEEETRIYNKKIK